MTIDRNSFEPIYLQISNQIKQDILAGKYQEGDKLPSESELRNHYEVTRTTVQKSLSILVNEGLIEREHGKGSFVKLRSVRKNIWNFSGFSDYAKKVHQTPITEVLEHRVFKQDGVPYFKIVRLRGFVENKKSKWITLDTSILSLDKFPGLDQYDFSTTSLYETLQNRYDTNPNNAQLSVKAIMITEEQASYFELPPQTPILNVQGEVYDEKGNVIEEVDVVYSSEADFNFIINI